LGITFSIFALGVGISELAKKMTPQAIAATTRRIKYFAML